MKTKRVNRNTIYIFIIIICLLIIACLTYFIFIPMYKKHKEEQRIKNATIIVNLKQDLTASFGEEKKISDYIESINGELIQDQKITTNELGKVEISFEYINDENIKVPYSYTIEVKDTTPPLIWLSNSYNVNVGYNGNIVEDIMCADDLDDNPLCEIVGEYNTNQIGSYNVIYRATDKAGNVTEKPFTLNVTQPSKTTYQNPTKRPFQEYIDTYKNEHTSIGIDVSEWQGNIDYDQVKSAGVEFAIIRIGGTKGINGDYFVDKYFKQNIEGFKRVGIPVGVYFYTYSNSKEKSIENAEWIINTLAGEELDLPIAYDWENFSFYNDFHLSFYNLTNNAISFMDTVEKAGYKGMLYGSKNYLDKVWMKTDYPIWLAHYTREPLDYSKEAKIWQVSSIASVPGINAYVDVDIMYK